MYSSDAHTDAYKGSIAVWRGVGKSGKRDEQGARGRGRWRERVENVSGARADQWRENMVATGCGIHQRRYSACTFSDLLLSSSFFFRPLSPPCPSVHVCPNTRGAAFGPGERLWEKNFPLKNIRSKGTAFVGSFHLMLRDAGKHFVGWYLHLLSATWKRIIALLPGGWTGPQPFEELRDRCAGLLCLLTSSEKVAIVIVGCFERLDFRNNFFVEHLPLWTRVSDAGNNQGLRWEKLGTGEVNWRRWRKGKEGRIRYAGIRGLYGSEQILYGVVSSRYYKKIRWFFSNITAIQMEWDHLLHPCEIIVLLAIANNTLH